MPSCAGGISYGQDLYAVVQVYREAIRGGFKDQGNGGLTGDPVIRIVDLQGKVVMGYVDDGVIGLAMGRGLEDDQQREQPC